MPPTLATERERRTQWQRAAELLLAQACGLLRARRERPRRRRDAEQSDELAAVDHSITSSARSKVAVGTSRPSALAALRLRMNWNFDARSIGRSAGLAPLRIRSTKEAARRKVATKSTPYPI